MHWKMKVGWMKRFSIKLNPYKTPIGYFEGFAADVIAKISLLENEDFVETHFTKNNPYQVSVGYFEGLANEILNKVQASENEEQVIGTYFTKVNPYQVPAGYFEGLANEILFKVDTTKQKDVPEGYFASLPNIILQKVRGLEVESELEQIAPLLNTINKLPINHVPAGYFEDLQPVLPQAVPAKVIGIKRKVNWFKNAVAACLIGTLGFTAYQLMDASVKPVSTIQTLSSENVGVPIPVANINVDEELSKVDDASIAKYLNNIEMPTEQATTHFQDVNSGDVDEALQDISDEAIQQHLEETGELSNTKN